MPRAIRRDDDMTGNDEWYERRLVEETGELRVELAGVETRLVDRIASVETRLVDRITTLEIVLRQEIAATELRLVKEIASVREAIQASQSTTTRWMFGFWVGQFAAMAGLFVMFR